jgi:hypothetical protein
MTDTPQPTEAMIEGAAHKLIEAARRYEAGCRLGGKDQEFASRKLDEAKRDLLAMTAARPTVSGEESAAADALDHVADALREVHALSEVGDPQFDASMLGQIAACERGASLLRRAVLAAMQEEPNA